MSDLSNQLNNSPAPIPDNLNKDGNCIRLFALDTKGNIIFVATAESLDFCTGKQW